ncbi:MAG: sugar ABC transporter permease [Anaerolineae bacterium]|nr:sugar ABC transporter permease [Anaerolineae bacterium]
MHRTAAQRSLRSRLTGYGNPLSLFLFLLPGFGVYLLLMLWPSMQSLYYSLVEWNGLSTNITFVGLENFTRMAGDRVVRIALENGLRNLFLLLAFQVPVGFLLAYLLSQQVRGRRVFVFCYFLPILISEATMALLWSLIYNGRAGLLNGVLTSIGLEALIVPWLSRNGTVQWAVLIPGVLQWLGFNVVLFLAAIDGIPQELFEVARLEGATALQEVRHVTLPGVRGVYVTAVILAIAGGISPFLYPFILTNAGPLDLTQTLMTYSFEKIYAAGGLNRNLEWGYGSALGVLHLVIGLALSGLTWYLGRLNRERWQA